MKYYNQYSPIELNNRQLVGGKAYNLRQFTFLKTPSWFVLTTSFFDSCFENLLPEIQNLFMKGKYQNINQIIDRFSFAPEIEKEIISKLKRNKKYAVRSSAVNEDNCQHSFAGIMTSILNVTSDNIIIAIKEVFKSAFTKRVRDYCQINDLPIVTMQTAVIIQEMVSADFSGVINTINPVTNNPDEIIISTIKGLGEQLVSGHSNSNDYIINRDNIIIEGDNILTAKLIKKLLKMTNKIILATNTFQDIEFAIRRGKVYFLQTRTIVPYAHLNTKSRRIVLDNANIIESYCGVTTPLTFSFAKEVYAKVYRQTLEVGKISSKIINNLQPALEELLYCYQNKIYYNLNNWYYMNSVFPSKKASSYMENMMGVKTKTNNYQKVKMNIWQLFSFVVLFLKRMKTIDEDSKTFLKKFNQVVMPFLGNDFCNYSMHQLLELYNDLEKNILNDFSTPIINDCGAMIYYAFLTRRINKLKIIDKDGYLGFLLGKQGGVESAMSAPLFFDILLEIEKDQQVKNDFLTLSCQDLYNKYHYDSHLSNSIFKYIQTFGPRVIDELKLETITMIENPLILYEMLKKYLITPHLVIENNSINYQVKIPFFQKRSFNRIVNKTKYFIKNREKLRLQRTYIYSVVRNIFLRMGHIFKQQGKILHFRDIFFLTKEEIFADINKENSALNYLTLVEERKNKYLQNQKLPIDNRLVIYGDAVLPIYSRHQKTNSNVLKGIPSGAGIVSGQVKYVNNPDDVITNGGEIILAYRTDPGWIPLFPLCKGLIVEKGSILSHSAVVAREMGIPAVVGINDATIIIKDGQEVILDGIKGEVTLK